MSRPTLCDLLRAQSEAKLRFPVGSFYRHQPSGKIYEVVGHSIREEDGEPQVHYCTAESLVNRDLIFGRRVSSFGEAISWYDGEITRFGERFKLVTKVEKWVDA